jgi:hypothetical protein
MLSGQGHGEDGGGKEREEKHLREGHGVHDDGDEAGGVRLEDGGDENRELMLTSALAGRFL